MVRTLALDHEATVATPVLEFSPVLTDEDQLVYVNGVLKGKLLENETLVQQAASNSKEQFSNSPDLKDALMHAIMDALDRDTRILASLVSRTRQAGR